MTVPESVTGRPPTTCVAEACRDRVGATAVVVEAVVVGEAVVLVVDVVDVVVLLVDVVDVVLVVVVPATVAVVARAARAVAPTIIDASAAMSSAPAAATAAPLPRTCTCAL